MVKFIDDEKKKYGVESICRILPIAPSTYYRIKDEQDNPEKQSHRKQSDKHLMAQIKQIGVSTENGKNRAVRNFVEF